MTRAIRIAIACTVFLVAAMGPLHAGFTITDLGTPGGPYSIGTGINYAGQVTGYSYYNSTSDAHAFLYSGGVMTDFGSLGGGISVGAGINNAGQTTGYSYTTGGGSISYRPIGSSSPASAAT